jgi:hypothetical protein
MMFGEIERAALTRRDRELEMLIEFVHLTFRGRSGMIWPLLVELWIDIRLADLRPGE